MILNTITASCST